MLTNCKHCKYYTCVVIQYLECIPQERVEIQRETKAEKIKTVIQDGRSQSVNHSNSHSWVESVPLVKTDALWMGCERKATHLQFEKTVTWKNRKKMDWKLCTGQMPAMSKVSSISVRLNGNRFKNSIQRFRGIFYTCKRWNSLTPSSVCYQHNVQVQPKSMTRT